MIDEKKLIQDSLKGDCRAFEILVEQYQAMVCAITFSATGQLETSEELAQETFFRAWKNLAQLKEITKFRFWLCSIARNILRTYYQQKQADKVSVCDDDTLETLATQYVQSPMDTLISREEEMILSQALLQIPEEYREPLVLFYRQQQSTKEVAESLELNEATVRTRLSRGRQMLKDQVATMVERTLEKTGPSKKFTKAVMVAIGGGLVAGTTATAGVAAAGASVSTTVTTTGLLTAAGAKVAAIAAAVILAAGAAIYSYQNSQENTPQPQPIQQQSLTEIAPQTESLATIAVKQEEIKPQPPAQQPPAKTVENETTSDPQPQTPKVRHPDWPGIDEPIKYIYMEMKETGIDGTEEVQKFWARLPDAFRDERQFNKITLDNGKQRLVLDPNTKQAQIEPTWYKDGKMIWQFQQLLEEHPTVKMAAVFRDPNSNPEIALTKLTTESDDTTTVYNVKVNEMSDPNGAHIKMWADNRTWLPEKLELIVVGDPNEFGNTRNAVMRFDFAAIADSIFAIDIPTEYKALPAQKTKGFTGRVIDLLGNPVAGAEVYLQNWTLGDRGPLKGISDENGNFSIILPQSEPGFNSAISLWAVLPYDSRFSAWTLFQYPENSKEPGGIVPGNPGIIEHSPDYYRYEKVSEKSTAITGYWCIGAFNIILVMEPGIKISGYVSDTFQNPVAGATVTATSIRLADQYGQYCGNGIDSLITPPKNFYNVKTDNRGYYEILNFPKLWKKCEFLTHINPSANHNLISDSKSIKIKDPNQPVEMNFILMAQGPTVRGVVVDNYGTPLPERHIRAHVNGRWISGFLAKTDKNGRFELRRCPADAGLQIKAALSENSMNTPEKEKSYVFYPDVIVDVGYQPGQDEYEVKLVAIKPEIEIEAVLMDSAGNPLPYFPVEIRAESVPIPLEWALARNFNKRTDENGYIRFVNVPEMEGLQLVCSVAVAHHREAKEMLQYLEQLDQDYRNIYYLWTEALVPLVPGQKKYQMTITIPTQEEYKQQKELEK